MLKNLGNNKKIMSGSRDDVASFIAGQVSDRWDNGDGRFVTIVIKTRGGLVIKAFPKRVNGVNA